MATPGGSAKTEQCTDSTGDSVCGAIRSGHRCDLARILLIRCAEGDSMSASAVAELVNRFDSEVPEVTLWELVWAVTEVADDEREVVATVAHMLTSGSVRVVGNPRDRSIRFA